ncbi:MAG: metallophosphoesterase [Gemmatimonadaceae bacterium]
MQARFLAVAAASWVVAACSGEGSRLSEGAGALARSEPATAGLDRAPSAVVLAAGDIARCQSSGDEATARLLDSLPGTVLALGDNVYRNGSPGEFRACYEPSWGRHRSRTRPAPGNHEYYVPGAEAYFDYFGAAAGPPGRGYYSFDVGGWHVISLNSNVDTRAGSPQERWLRADLAAHPARCTLAFWHHARYSSGRNHGSTPRLAPLWEALYEANADVVLQAHDHVYERLAPLGPRGRPEEERGMRSFVIGTGGAGVHGFGRTVVGSEIRYNGGPGVLKLTLRPDGYAWEFIAAVPTGFTDRGEGRCH